jgi:hypothetical protein
LRWRGVVLVGEPGERSSLPREGSRGEGEPGDEPDAVGFGVFEQPLGGAVGEVVPVLNGDDGGDPLRFLELLDREFGQLDVADLPLVLEQLELTRT